MVDWIIILALYAFGAGFFRALGGLGAAADAIASWGRTSSSRRSDPASPGT
jgi:hypothetical protein